jgi:hypothetical protein
MARQTGGDAGARTRSSLAFATAGLAAALALTFATPATAGAEEGDGLYGRLDGDLDLRIEAGSAFARGGPALAAGVTALYLQTAGLYAHYTDALGAEGPAVMRSLAVGALVTPLFLARYSKDLEHSGPYPDMLLDAVGLEVGAFWDAPRGGRLGPIPGIEIAAVASIPLFPRASGLFLGLRGALRFRADAMDGRAPGDALDRGAVLSVTLSWHQLVLVHLVDAGDEMHR